MSHFADRLIAAIEAKGNPCVVGLDPRIDGMPHFVTSAHRGSTADDLQTAGIWITRYHEVVIRHVADLVPAVKLQVAFYEQYGMFGVLALTTTIEIAKRAGLLVIVDAKRNDIDSTAEAYASSLLGRVTIAGVPRPVFDADCITVSPYLGGDSLAPFVKTCETYGKGLFVVVKSSNKGSAELQDLPTGDKGVPVYLVVAEMVNRHARGLIGERLYSSIGAVVGATFPEEAAVLRAAMPRSLFLVPGYGSQGGTAKDAAHCFNADGLGAVVAASRSLTYGFESLELSEDDVGAIIRRRTQKMIADVTAAIHGRKV